MRELSGKTNPSELLAVIRMAPDDVATDPRGQASACARARHAFEPRQPGHDRAIVRRPGRRRRDRDRSRRRRVRPRPQSRPAEGRCSRCQWCGWTRRRQWRAGCADVQAGHRRVRRSWAQTRRGARSSPRTTSTRPPWCCSATKRAGSGRRTEQMCDALVRIPMSGSASSLNVSVAASIVLYEASRQRRAASA